MRANGTTGKRRTVAHNAESVVQEAMDYWRRTYDPALWYGPTMAEAIVDALRQTGLLIDGEES